MTSRAVVDSERLTPLLLGAVQVGNRFQRLFLLSTSTYGQLARLALHFCSADQLCSHTGQSLVKAANIARAQAEKEDCEQQAVATFQL